MHRTFLLTKFAKEMNEIYLQEEHEIFINSIEFLKMISEINEYENNFNLKK